MTGRYLIPTRVNRGLLGLARGISLSELLVVLGLVSTMAALSVPLVARGVDAARARAGARYLAARLQFARLLAVKRSQYVALRFEPIGDSFQLRFYADGNGNGVRTTEIERRVDVPLGPPERLEDQFPGVSLGFAGDVPGVDGTGRFGPMDSPVRVGSSRLLSFSPLGTATSGTIYVRGRNFEQHAVRVLGPTGRIRLLRLDRATGRWDPQ